MTRRIRVLHVAESAGWAGGEAWLVRVAGAIHPRFAIGVLVPEAGALIARLDALGVPSWHVRRAQQLLSVRALADLVRLFRHVAPSIVHSHGARSNVYTRLAARLAGVPGVVSSVHNSLLDYPVPPMRRRAYVALERLTSPLADRILPVSGAIAHDLVERYRIDRSRVTIVRNGIDADQFAGESTAGAPLGLAGPLIGVVARMTAQKAHGVLLDAMPLIRARVPRLGCLMIGDGVLRSALEERARRIGVADACRFLGARNDVARLLAALDVAVLPSCSEGLPFAVLEAMAVGKPVVATRVGGLAEVIEDGVTGHLVPPGDAGALAAAIVSLLTDPDRARTMGQAAAHRVRTQFTLTGMVSAIEAVYDETLGSARPHAIAERAG
jgi:glycosyltransferase involved in cell wall biosynthesis